MWCRSFIAHFQKIGAADELTDGVHAECGHVFTQLSGNEEHEAFDIFRLAGKVLSQFRILCGNAHRAVVVVAQAHHFTSQCNERCSGKAKFFSTKDAGKGHIGAVHEFAVGFQAHTRTQVVGDQRLMCFRQAEFPWQPSVMDRVERYSTSAAVCAGYEYDLGTSFGNACSNGADAGFTGQLHGNIGVNVGIFEIVDELREVFNGVNIVMRWWRDQRHARCCIAQLGNVRPDFLAWQMPAFTRLGPLRHFDLDFFGTG